MEQLPQALVQKVGAALKAKQVATKEDLIQNYPWQVTVSPDYICYANPRVTAGVDALSPSEVTHIQFTPLTDAGYIVVTACAGTDAGATQFVRSESRRTGNFTIRTALNGFNINWPDDRKLRFKVTPADIPMDGNEIKKVLLIQVKKATSAKTVSRPRKDETQTASAKQTETKPQA